MKTSHCPKVLSLKLTNLLSPSKVSKKNIAPHIYSTMPIPISYYRVLGSYYAQKTLHVHILHVSMNNTLAYVYMYVND
jgi:hypothetical protein